VIDACPFFDMLARFKNQLDANLQNMTRSMIEKLMPLVNDSRKDNNMNDLPMSSLSNLTFDTSISKDITYNSLVMTFTHPFEFEEGEKSDNDVSVYAT